MLAEGPFPSRYLSLHLRLFWKRMFGLYGGFNEGFCVFPFGLCFDLGFSAKCFILFIFLLFLLSFLRARSKVKHGLGWVAV